MTDPHRRPGAEAQVLVRSRREAWRSAAAAAGLAVLALGAATVAHGQEAAADVIVSHGISTFGDLALPADFPHLAYVNPEAPRGGEMSIWAFGGFDSMHPYSIQGRAGALSSIFFESILEGTADEIGASYCFLCTTMEYPEDRSWVIFNLRDDVRFSNGAPMTADDVIFSFEILLEKGLPDFRQVLSQQVASVEALGPYRVRFDFAEGFPARDLPALVGGLPIFNRAEYEASGRDFEATSLTPMLGTGPYVLDRMDVGQRLVYRRNPDYWGSAHPINVGRWNFETIRVEYYADFNAAFEGFKAGDYTFRNEASSLIWATGYNFPAYENGHVVRATLPDGSLATGQSFVFNLRREQFQDPRVREAIGLMFNFEWSNQTLFYDLYARINSFWENSELAATGLPSEEERAILEPLRDILPPGVLDGEAVMAPVSSPDRQFDRANLTRASALLDEAGWEVRPPPPTDPRLPPAAAVAVALLILAAGGFGAMKARGTPLRAGSALVGVAGAAAAYWYLGMPIPSPEDGLRRDADGRVLAVEILNDSQTFDRVIDPYIENLRRLGIDARHTRVDNAQLVNRERTYDFDMLTHQMPMSFIPGSGLMQYFGSETADMSVFNLMGLRSEAVDRLIEVVLAADSNAELVPATRALDRVLRAERFWVPQWFKDSHTVAYFDMYDHPDPLPPYTLGNLDLWWFDAERAAALRAAGAIR